MEVMMLNSQVVPIEFVKGQGQTAKKLVSIIDRNRVLFKQMFTGKEKLSIIPRKSTFLDNSSEIIILDCFFHQVVSFCRKEIDRAKGDQSEEKLKTTLLEFMLIKNRPKLVRKYQLEDYNISTYAVYMYCVAKNKIDSFIDYLCGDKVEEVEQECTIWLKQESSQDLLNSFLESYQTLLKECNCDSLLLNMPNHVIGWIIYDYERLSALDVVKPDYNHFQPLSKDELDHYMIEFLAQIDPSLNWLDKYTNLKRENRINYSCDSWEYDRNNNTIEAALTGTIKDFRSMVHEFIHFIMDSSGADSVMDETLVEFPPILFEYLATEFLKRKGFSNTISLSLMRKDSIDFGFLYSINQLVLLSKYLKDGPIAQDKGIAYCEEMDNAIASLNDEELKQNTKERAKREIKKVNLLSFDSINDCILAQEKALVIDAYPYLIGHFFATETLDRLNKKTITMSDLICITEKLFSMPAIDVAKRIGIVESKQNSFFQGIPYIKKED